MTGHIPEGNTLRPLSGVIIDLSNGLIDEPPARSPHMLAMEQERRLATMAPRFAEPRPPYLALIVAFAVTGAAGFGAGWFLNKALANAAAAVVQAHQMK